MELETEIRKVINGLIDGISQAYGIFLEEEGLKDAPLARMTYFSTVKKAYLEDPVAHEEVQTTVIFRLDDWMARTNEQMVAAMPPTPDSLTLHVVRKVMNGRR